MCSQHEVIPFERRDIRAFDKQVHPTLVLETWWLLHVKREHITRVNGSLHNT
jgi:hypothetical protein